MVVIKRNGKEVEFEKSKIYNAITKTMIAGIGKINEKLAKKIADEIEEELQNEGREKVYINEIETKVYTKLIKYHNSMVAKTYEGYRAIREFQRKTNTIDQKVLGVVKGNNIDIKDNSNKNTKLISTMRDLVAEEVSKDIALRTMLPTKIAQAHNEGLIYIHDLGHYLNPSFNCFTSDTEFITRSGVCAFKDCYNGEVVEVIDKDGKWQKATIRNYGKKPMQKVLLQSGRSQVEVRCTYDHRWILNNGEVTTNLKVGDILIMTPEKDVEPNINPEYFTLGFILGDGNDIDRENSKGMSVRLCGEKNKYKNLFMKAGYKEVYTFSNGDSLMQRYKNALKENFIKNKIWEYLPSEALVDIFRGYYEADGSKDRNLITTANENLVEFIKKTSALCGYYVSSIKLNEKSTNYSEKRRLWEIHFRKYTISNNSWKVINIDRTDAVPREAWCVEQPVNYSFTLANGIVTGNCCLLNLEDMLQNSTVVNGKMITKPHSFRTACTIATQIIAQVASGQFGGQTITLTHLAPFVRISKEKIKKEIKEEYKLFTGHDIESEEDYNEYMTIVEKKLADEIAAGIQTFQYQINTLQTSNGSWICRCKTSLAFA